LAGFDYISQEPQLECTAARVRS